MLLTVSPHLHGPTGWLLHQWRSLWAYLFWPAWLTVLAVHGRRGVPLVLTLVQITAAGLTAVWIIARFIRARGHHAWNADY